MFINGRFGVGRITHSFAGNAFKSAAILSGSAGGTPLTYQLGSCESVRRTTVRGFAPNFAAPSASVFPPSTAQAHAPVEAPAAPAPEEPAGIPAPDDVAAPPAGAERTATGVASRVLQPGTGRDHPTAQDVVIVHYTGWTTDGEMFDSSVQRGRPISFPLRGVIPGWTEGLQLMVRGEKRRLWIPEELAYRGQPGRPAGMLVFDVELLGIEATPPVTPDNVAAAPRNAERTASGIASLVLQPGTGTAHPTASNSVTVHYSGWTTDGALFDSSLRRGREATFPLNGVIPGWTEGMQLMVAGEKRRFWIPGNLAYDGQPERPQGTLVFDVTLIAID